MKKILFCIVGRTCAGKTEIAKEISRRYGLKPVRSYTTRPPRPAEIANGLENSDHIFISEEEFDRLEPVARVTINGYRYCTTKDILMESDLYVIDPKGIADLKRNIGNDIRIIECYVDAGYGIRKQRYMSRGESEEAFKERDRQEDDIFRPYENKDAYDLVIRNSGFLEDAIQDIAWYIQICLWIMSTENESCKDGKEG